MNWRSILWHSFGLLWKVSLPHHFVVITWTVIAAFCYIVETHVFRVLLNSLSVKAFVKYNIGGVLLDWNELADCWSSPHLLFVIGGFANALWFLNVCAVHVVHAQNVVILWWHFLHWDVLDITVLYSFEVVDRCFALEWEVDLVGGGQDPCWTHVLGY